MASRLTLALLLAALLFTYVHCSVSPPPTPKDSVDDDDEDLSFLEESDDKTASAHGGGGHHEFPDLGEEDDDEYGNFSDFEDSDGGGGGDDEAYKAPEVDEKDVVVLKERNFSSAIDNNKFVMVEFFAPWCGHCQSLAPEYAAAATELKASGVVLAKVDGTEESELAHEYDVQGFPTIFFFADGVRKPYTGLRTKEAIVNWITKKTGPGVNNITTTEEAEKILGSESKVVLGFLNSLVGPESEELASASRLEDDVSFYQTVNPDVAKLFHIESAAKKPALVLIKKESEKLSHFDGKFEKSSISEFVFANKLPLVTIFTRENAPTVFESTIKKQLLLFATSNDSKTVIPSFQEAAKFFKGKLIFVYVELDNEDVGKPVADYFGVSGDAPTVLAYTGNDDGKKFVLGKEVTTDNVKAFGEDFLEDKLKPFFKSDPIPEVNDGDVKIVVGDNFDSIVLDESKDVLLEIYAPWCGHCQALEPTFNKLAKHLRDIKSIVIAKMDGTTNEHPRAKSDGFPTLLFFPAGSKSFDPITVDTDRTVVAFYKFIKKNAMIPFKLQKPAAPEKPLSPDEKEAVQSPDIKASVEKTTGDVKDEL